MAARRPRCFYAKKKERDGEWVKATVFGPRKASDPSKSQGPTKRPKDCCPVCKLSPNSPWSEEQKDEHIQHCLGELERQRGMVRRSIQRSREMECGICLENILDAQNPSRLQCQKSFGILDQCNHKFCLPCIRRWRSDETIRNYRKCPCCRIPSDFVAPAVHWVEGNDREELINKHKENLSVFKTMTEALMYFLGSGGESELINFYGTFFYISPELDDLAYPKDNQRLCVEEEIARVEVDDRQVTAYLQIMAEIVRTRLNEAFTNKEAAWNSAPSDLVLFGPRKMGLSSRAELII